MKLFEEIVNSGNIDTIPVRLYLCSHKILGNTHKWESHFRLKGWRYPRDRNAYKTEAFQDIECTKDKMVTSCQNVTFWLKFRIEDENSPTDSQNAYSVQFSSVAQSCPTLCNPMNCSTPGLPVHHKLPELTQTHVHRVSDAIQPSHPLSSLSPPAPNPSQHQSLFQWVNSSHEVAKVLEFQL